MTEHEDEVHVLESTSAPASHLHHEVSHVSETPKDVVAVMKVQREDTPEPPGIPDREENDIERYDGTKFKRQVRATKYACVLVNFPPKLSQLVRFFMFQCMGAYMTV